MTADITGGGERDALHKDDDAEAQPGEEEGVLVGLPLPQLLLRGPLPTGAPGLGRRLLLLLEDGRAARRRAADHGRRRLQRLGVLALAAALGLLALLAPRARGRGGDAEHGWRAEEGQAGAGEQRGGEGRHGDGVGLLFLRRRRGRARLIRDSLRGGHEVGFVGLAGPERRMDARVLLSGPWFPFIDIFRRKKI